MNVPEHPRRYKNRHLDHAYWVMLEAARNKNSELYLSDGNQRGGALHRCAFWDGFNGVNPSPHKGEAGTMTYVCYMAGKAFKKEKEKAHGCV